METIQFSVDEACPPPWVVALETNVGNVAAPLVPYGTYAILLGPRKSHETPPQDPNLPSKTR